MCPGRRIVRTSALRSYIYLHREWKRPIYHADFQERAVSGIPPWDVGPPRNMPRNMH